MPDYRRAVQPGGSFFFTVVTAGRGKWLCTELARGILHRVLAECGERWPFELEAVVLLPDHLHAMWVLPEGDAYFSKRWAWIKRTFAARWLAAGGVESKVSEGRRRVRRRGVWQPRFWEHLIRDERDRAAHMDYVHYNPVKHGVARCPHEWPHSSFGRWVERGGYEREWQCGCGREERRALDFPGLPVAEME